MRTSAEDRLTICHKIKEYQNIKKGNELTEFNIANNKPLEHNIVGRLCRIDRYGLFAVF